MTIATCLHPYSHLQSGQGGVTTCGKCGVEMRDSPLGFVPMGPPGRVPKSIIMPGAPVPDWLAPAGIPIGVPSELVNLALAAARMARFPDQEMAGLALALVIIAKERGRSLAELEDLVRRAHAIDVPLVPLDAAG